MPKRALRRLLALNSLSALALLAATDTQTPSPTFYKDVLPVLQQHCQTCHRPGELGPMPLIEYAATRPWAAAIAQAVSLRQMPPWFADPSIGHFANDRSLSDADVQTIKAWA